MGRKKGKATERFSIPVSKSLASEVQFFADRFERSQSWMARTMIEVALENRDNVAHWIGSRLMTALATPIIGRRKKSTDEEEVRIQTLLLPETSQRIHQAAAELSWAPLKFAGLLLDCAVSDERWVMHLVTSKAAKSVADSILGEWRGKTGKATGTKKAAGAKAKRSRT